MRGGGAQNKNIALLPTFESGGRFLRPWYSIVYGTIGILKIHFFISAKDIVNMRSHFQFQLFIVPFARNTLIVFTVLLPDTSVLNYFFLTLKKYKNVLSGLSTMIPTAHTKHYSKIQLFYVTLS